MTEHLALDAGAVLARVRELPSLPALMFELIESLDNENFGAEQLAAKIGNDQALTAKTLRLANSSFYGMSREITSVSDAAAILGLRTLRGVATAAVLAGHFEAGSANAASFRSFWRHSIGTALCSAALAMRLRMDEGQAFTLGLLHDIGRLALASAFPQPFALALEHQRLHDCAELQAERAVLGIDHAEVGSLIAEHWHFAPALVEGIRGHHLPPAAEGAPPSLADIVHVADNMVHALDLAQAEADMVPTLDLAAWTRLGLEPIDCFHVFEETEAQHDAVCSALLA